MSEGAILAAEEESGAAPEVSLPAPICPRCGYDQTGVVMTWEDSCPLWGTCSECGLRLDWGVILNATLRGPTWSYEHGHRRTFARWAGTSVRTLWPWRFHRNLLMAHTIRPRRLARFAVLWVLVWPLLVHMLAVAVAWFQRSPYFWWEWTALLIFPYRDFDDLLDWIVGGSYLAGLCVLPFVLMGALLGILDTTFRRARVRRVHLVRGVCYGAPTAAIVPAALAAGSFVALEVAVRFVSWDVERVLPWLPLLWALWLGAWWHQFVRHYLQLPSAGIIVGVLMVPTVLGTVLMAGAIGFVLAAVSGK